MEAETAAHLTARYGIKTTHIGIADYDHNIHGIDAK